MAAAPWIITPIVTVARVRNSRSLSDESGAVPEDPPLVSVIIPARNEARNIGRCLRSVLATTYPNVEIIVVDDHSEDATGDIARTIAAEDARVRVTENESLPEGWFGKQWACSNGARNAHGEILLFADADTSHSPDLLTRSVNAITRRHADLFSIAGRQELGSFWERIIQPQVFGIMATRYGGTESVTNSPRVTDKIANGQCLFVKREAYDSAGGHGLVRQHVADDLMMAQKFFARGNKVVLQEGLDQLSTRMYTSFGELLQGWGKNVFAGGRDSVPMGRLGRFFYPLLLPATPLMALLPPMALLASLVFQLPAPLLAWAWISTVTTLLWWAFTYRSIGESPMYAFLFPLGSGALFYIFARAVWRGQRVTWKGRAYTSA